MMKTIMPLCKKSEWHYGNKLSESDDYCALAAIAWLAVMAIILYTSSMLHPRDKSFTGRAIPCRKGPTAVAWPRRSTSL